MMLPPIEIQGGWCGASPSVLHFWALFHNMGFFSGTISMRDSKKTRKFGLAGTVTRDVITHAGGRVFSGLGGILYQAASLCGLGKEVCLYTNLGEKLLPEVQGIMAKWPACLTRGMRVVPGPGNSVFLHYPEEGERVEILESCVPALSPGRILRDLPGLAMLIVVINSGFDIELGDWKKISRAAPCPIWFDVHSLALSRVLHAPRLYRSLTEWTEWAEGVTYLQANLKEVASLQGDPGRPIHPEDLKRLGESSFRLGLKAVFITLGKDGVMVMTPETSQVIGPREVGRITDTTGCGDVFCAGTAALLVAGVSPTDAAAFGVELASEAARVSGVEETYNLVKNRVYRA